MNRAMPRDAERGQTLPIWTAAVLAALTLMFFSLNYANVIRWQVRAQNAADAAAFAALSIQATQWNKMTTIMYAADIEEWRIRHILQAIVDLSNHNGGCNYSSGQCLRIYQSLQPQYLKAVNRYTAEIQMLQSLATIGHASQAADASAIIRNLKASCGSATELADCAFTYHIVDYSSRTTYQQAGKDAFYLQLGNFTSPQDSIPVSDWEPARMEIATCATVKPLVNFSIFGIAPQSFTVIGRAAATNVTETSEWMAPGATQNPSNGNALFQAAENYDPADDTFAGSSSPRDWYETTFPAVNYTAYKAPVNNYYGPVYDDFEVMVCWWAAVQYQPYVAVPQTKGTLCAQT